jgi:hypothetical protein
MGCIGCGSVAVSERSERTAQGYRRFRCRTCGKQFNERSAGSLNRTQYPSDVIALVVLWRLRYKLALRDLPEAKQLTAANQAEMVPARVTMVGERPGLWMHPDQQGSLHGDVRSRFGDVPVRVRHLQAGTPATVLFDGDAGRWLLQPGALGGPRSCWTGSTPPCVSSTRSSWRWASAQARPTRSWPTRPFVAWSVRSGVFGTGIGRGAGASSRPWVAGRSANLYAMWSASGVSGGTSVICWATSSETRAGALRCPTSTRRTNFDRVRGESSLPGRSETGPSPDNRHLASTTRLISLSPK